MDDRAHFPQLSDRLLRRRTEMCEAVLSQAHQVAAVPIDDAVYIEGMRSAALAAVDYGRDVFERRDGLPPVPAPLLAQARLAAASGVGVDSVIRRYVSGNATFSAATVEVAYEVGLSSEAIQQVMNLQSEAFDQLISAVTDEYAKQVNRRSISRETHRLELIESLLAGAPVSGRDLGYELDQNHVALITSASHPKGLLLDLGRQIDRQVLVAQRSEHEIWAWLGGKKVLRQEDLERGLARFWPKALPLSLGEDCQGRAGWCLSHRQALRSWPAALRDPATIVPYRHVALSSAILQDDDFVSFLEQSYLSPLLEGQGGKESPLCETLCMYFSTGGNVASTAAALSVSRQTVTNRLRQAEERVGEAISSCRVELECALRLFEGRHEASLSLRPA